MVEIEDRLFGILHKMLDDIKEPDYHNWLYANYFDIQVPIDRTVTRWWQAPLFLIWNPEFVDEELLCDVILMNHLPARHERIKIEYNQIYRITRFMIGIPTTEAESLVYTEQSKFRMPSC
jgi:hypothetical protein